MKSPHLSKPESSPRITDTEEQLADVLERYVIDLEQGRAPRLEELTNAHPDLAELLPDYLEGVRLIHDALPTASPLASQANARDSSARPPAADDRPVAGQIGDYELVRELGRGGMGIVYEARQMSLNRRVALKMLPFAAVLDERQISRFRTEAQAAAGLHHPNIVPVFAVGQERGVHFYAMQFVDGQSLGQAIEELQAVDNQPDASPSSTTADERGQGPLSTIGSIRESAYFRHVARLGAEAAEALDHAHQFGVVHRDIKPSNLIVDRTGKLWVTDFGLARVQTEMSVTLPGDVIGTLRYMSPEQARGRGDLVDGRTDVYALGATLYEMVCLEPAHRGDDQQSLLEWINSAPLIAPRRLNPAVPVDLETIILRAMQHHRDDRYTTAGQLADDLRRYLAGKPTLARRSSVIERASRWVARRRKMAVAAAAMLALLTIVSTVSALWIASANRQTVAALADSEANRQRAEAHYQQARHAVDHFAADVADRLAEVAGAERLTHELLVDTLGYYQAFLDSAESDPALEHDLAVAHFKSGAILLRLGKPAEAREQFAQAVVACRRQQPSGPQRSAPRQQATFALALGALARVEGQLGQFQEAEKHFAEAIVLGQSLAQQQPTSASSRLALAETLANHGAMWRRAGNAEAAATRIRSAIAQLEAVLSINAENTEALHHLAVANNNLSDTLRGRNLEDALAASHKAVATMQQLTRQQPAADRFQADLAMTRNNLAAIEATRGEWQATAEGYGQAVKEIEQLLRRQPLVPRYRKDLAITLGNLGMALSRTGEAPASDRAFARARQTLTDLIRDFPQQLAYETSLSALLNNQGVALRDAGRWRQAAEVFSASVRRQEQAFATAKPTARRIAMLEKQYRNYAEVLRIVGETEQLETIEKKRKQLAEKYPPATITAGANARSVSHLEPSPQR